MVHFQIGNLLNPNRVTDTLVDLFDQAVQEAEKIFNKCSDKDFYIGIWSVDDEWRWSLVAIYTDGRLFQDK